MSDRKKNIIIPVLIPAGGNKLQLADISFDSKIRNIVPKSEKVFDWEDINTLEKRNALLSPFIRTPGEFDLLLAIPGGIDPHVHFDTPGYEFREDIEHASMAAAIGGTTTVIDMPCTSIPAVTSVKNLNEKLSAIKDRSYIDFAFWGGVSGCDFNKKEIEKNILELAEAGVAGFKVYMISGMDSFADLTEEQIEFAAGVIGRTGKPMAVHAEDKKLVLNRQKEYQLKNQNTWKDYCSSRDVLAEVTAVQKLISIARRADCRIHVVHLSSKAALQLIRNAISEGLNITAETCPHYLHFTQKDFENDSIRNYLKTAPPVKFEEDKDSLWEGLADGSICFITTDHAGCDPDQEKNQENFWDVYGGIPGVEHRLPFLFSEGFQKGKLTLEQTVKLLTANSADYFGLNWKGYLKPGYDADIVLLDLWNSEIITSSGMHSKGKYTPFEGVRINCVVKNTFLKGENLQKKKFSGRFLPLIK